MSEFWGEIPVSNGSYLSHKEVIQLTRLPDIQAPPIHQPSTKHVPPGKELAVEDFGLPPLIRHTIHLVQYARRARVLIQQIRQQLHDLKSNEGESQTPTFPTTPAIPEYDGPPLKHQDNKPIPFLGRDLDSDFVRGIGKAPPEIDSTTNRKLLRKSVAAVCAHAGYDACNESVLETLTDISHDYLLQLTRLLRVAVDEEALTTDTGFTDAMERVFHDMGIGSTASVHEFYQDRVIRYHKHMIHVCQSLQRDLDRMKNPDFQFDDPNFLRSKDEPQGEGNILFPAQDEADINSDNDQMQLDGLALDVCGTGGTSNTDEDTKWPHSVKSEHSDSRVGNLDSFDESQSVGASDVAHTPAMSSEAGESIQDPGSVSASDLMSPPASLPVSRTSGKPPKKKKKR